MKDMGIEKIIVSKENVLTKVDCWYYLNEGRKNIMEKTRRLYDDFDERIENLHVIDRDNRFYSVEFDEWNGLYEHYYDEDVYTNKFL